MIRFYIDIARSSIGERGWNLVEVVDGVPHFVAWFQMGDLLRVRQRACELGGTAETTAIEGIIASRYRAPESGYALSADEMRGLGYTERSPKCS